MLCYQFSQVWVHYEVSHLFTGLSTAYIIFYLPKVKEVIPAQRTTLALEKEIHTQSVNNQHHPETK